ncbi:MAG: CRTAC1 family protein [Maribacter sp.]|uniref:CRTAC1 family protein n=1 Tax=Maribacter sp. TaxID=1897614 RepID=UPI003C72E4DE
MTYNQRKIICKAKNAAFFGNVAYWVSLTCKNLAVVFIMVGSVVGCNSENKSSDSSNKSILKAPAANDEFFQSIGQEIGLDFKHSIGADHMENIIESVGGGAAFLDYDQDGFMDIYVCSGTWVKGFSKSEEPKDLPTNHLYHNNQDGTYEDVTQIAKVGGPWYSMGVTVGDYNNDGFPDIYVSNNGPNTLYKNKGDGTFSNETEKASVGGGKYCSVGAVWMDYDNDGFLDLYVGNYLNFDPDYKYYYAPDGFPGPLAYDSQPDILYHNNGDGTFEDVTQAMGIIDIDGRAMGVGAADYDDDGFVDIYVANDHTVNYLWHNDAGKGFSDRGTMSGTGFSQSGEATVSMSVDFADYNGDELLDIFISDDNYCSLYENLGKGVFSDQSYYSGISVASGQFVGWSSSFFDYDNDGDADIFKTNGELKHLYGQEDQLFENTEKGKFKDVSVERGAYFKEEHVGRGACLGDYDNDGDIDIYIVNLDSVGVFLRNNKANENNWITLKLIGKTSNRDGIGARIKIISGGKVQTAQKKSTTGYLSQNDPRLHFGLLKNDLVEKIEIKWPSSKIQVLEQVKANQILTIEEPL